MKNMLFIVLILSLFIITPLSAQVDIEGPSTSGAFSPIGGSNAQAGATASATGGTGIGIGGGAIVNNRLDVDTNIRSTNILGQFGYVAPVQQVNIETPQSLLTPPSQSVPEINFGQGRLDWNFAKALPKVAIPLYNPNETVVKVLDTTANVKAKNLLPTLLDMVADRVPIATNERLIIIKAEAQKTWTTGGNAGGAGSYLPTSGLAGASGAGSIVPSWGGTKADDLYTIIIVRVAW